MKKISLFLLLIVTGCLTFSAQTEQVVPEQLQAKPLTGYIQIGEVDVNGWFTVEYVGNENVNLSVLGVGSNIIGHNSDLNHDGAVNIADVSALIDMLLH